MKFLALGALVAAAFAFWHTGARASALCTREVFVSGGSLSLWPPGTRCEYGLPVQSDTFLNLWFFATAFALVTIFILTDTIRSSRAADPSRP
jgi:hypothetical protein